MQQSGYFLLLPLDQNVELRNSTNGHLVGLQGYFNGFFHEIFSDL